MDAEEQIQRLNALAHYIREGGTVIWHEPEPRNKKGPDRAAVRDITIRVTNPARFDAVAWRLMRREWSRRR